MCRLYGFISNEPTKVDCSLVFSQNALMQQSRVDQTGRNHADGWGIVAYKDGVPELHKKSMAAYDDIHFSTAAESIYSTEIIAHVRRATIGKNSIYNTHPFVSGRWCFAHNGTVTGIQKIRSQLEQETLTDLRSQRKGDTDSEQYFLWLLSRLYENGMDSGTLESDSTGTAAGLIKRSVERLAALCKSAAPDETPRLNFILTDGSTLVACRWDNSLYRIERRGIYQCEICGIPHIHHHETVDHHAVAFASEPVTHEDWQEVPNQSLEILNLGKTIQSH